MFTASGNALIAGQAEGSASSADRADPAAGEAN
jgi:hypothetical protein